MRRLGMMLAVMAGLGLGTSALAQDAKVARTWKAKCSSCHGADGKGETAKGKKMQVGSVQSAAFKKKSDEELKKVILEGVKEESNGVTKEMDGYKDELSAEQIDALVAHMRHLGDAK
jgi:cytochrome c6